ncbi:MAG: thermonuclease family protein [Beijerinckiaceae bacterium]
MIVGFILLFAAGAASLRHMRGQDVVGPATAIDGDSIRLYDREIRLRGIDAPEYRQICTQADKREWPCGRQARRELADLLGRGNARCRLDGKDRFGRDLGACEVNGESVNAAMVRAGFAVAFGAYEAEENSARQARRGLWASTFERPGEWRARHPRGDAP